MVKVEKNVDAREFAKNSSPILFVEGGGTDRFDVRVMKTLFDGTLEVEPLGPSDGVRFAAEAFRQSYPYYFFLIDRDTLSDDAVEKSWQQFDSHEGKNLLILRKREIENYFLDPEFLSTSRYFSTGLISLRKKILCLAQERLYLDALNYVVITLREELKNSRIALFSVDKIKNEEDALGAIRDMKGWISHIKKSQKITSADNMKKSISGTFGVFAWQEQRHVELELR